VSGPLDDDKLAGRLAAHSADAGRLSPRERDRLSDLLGLAGRRLPERRWLQIRAEVGRLLAKAAARRGR
jgi:hypothetical protein